MGEIMVRHDLPWRLNKGYLGMPEATAEAWRDGWFHTGDAGGSTTTATCTSSTGSRTACDRGHNISSSRWRPRSSPTRGPRVRLRRSSFRHFGRGRQVKDDDVKVYAVAAAGSNLTGEQIIDFLTPRAPKFMLSRYVEILPSLPKTAAGKVKKVELRQLAAGEGCYDRGPDRRK